MGRFATQAARILIGEDETSSARPLFDMGDHVVIINAEKVVFTSNKLQELKLQTPHRLAQRLKGSQRCRS